MDWIKRQQFPELAEALHAQADAIVGQWERLVRDSIPAANSLNVEQLRDHLPLVLHELGVVLGRSQESILGAVAATIQQHGELRFDQNFNIEELLIEYRLLRRVIVAQVAAAMGRRLDEDEDLALHVGIDALLEQAVVAFVNQQKRQIEAAAAAESKFLRFVSHDLRNNLNSITLTLALLRRRLQNLPEFAEDVEDLDTVRQSITETMDAMERLLHAERLRKKPEIRIAKVRLGAVATDVVRRFEPQAERKGVAVAAEVPEEAVVESDREWLTLALANLVGNAVKFSDHGLVQVRAEPRADVPGGWSLSVSDQGMGIAEADQQRLFQEYERGQARGRKGVGLGLVIVAQAARMLGGEVRVESQVGRGSTFTILLPPRP